MDPDWNQNLDLPVTNSKRPSPSPSEREDGEVKKARTQPPSEDGPNRETLSTVLPVPLFDDSFFFLQEPSYGYDNSFDTFFDGGCIDNNQLSTATHSDVAYGDRSALFANSEVLGHGYQFGDLDSGELAAPDTDAQLGVDVWQSDPSRGSYQCYGNQDATFPRGEMSLRTHPDITVSGGEVRHGDMPDTSNGGVHGSNLVQLDNEIDRMRGVSSSTQEVLSSTSEHMINVAFEQSRASETSSRTANTSNVLVLDKSSETCSSYDVCFGVVSHLTLPFHQSF